MKKLLTLLFPAVLFGQNFDMKFPIDHQPFITVTASPMGIFDIHNTMQAGVEISPPFGKFSFQADYGKGVRNLNLHRGVRQVYETLNTNIFRAEIKTYQSDWFFFHQLDRKPLGRYFSFEVLNKNVNAAKNSFITAINNTSLTEGYLKAIPLDIKQTDYVANLKYGKHFIFSRWLVLDVFGGAGVRQYAVKQSSKTLNAQAYKGYIGLQDWLPKEKGLLPNATLGFRFCFVL